MFLRTDYIARDMLFQKNDGFCDSLYNKTGVEILKYGAEQGDAKAQFALGCYYGGCEYNKADGAGMNIVLLMVMLLTMQNQLIGIFNPRIKDLLLRWAI